MNYLRLGPVALAAMLGLMSCGACGRPDEEAEASGTSPLISTDKALVQVLIYGLAAFGREYDVSGKLVKIGAHIPELTMPKHDMGLYRGKKNGQHRWVPVTKDDMNRDIRVEGREIRIDMMGELSQTTGATIDDYPDSPEEAADVGWMLQADEIDDVTGFDKSHASTHVIFETGTLETCALVFNPKPWDKACIVKVDNDKKVERSVSEIMVVRGWVLKNASGPTTVEIELKGLSTQTVTIPETGGDPVTWKNPVTGEEKIYTSVIDIAISNIYDSPGRKMTTDHGNYLKRLFQGASRSWDMEAFKCVPNRQPKCWTDYFTKLFAGSPSGIDRPICPLVGGP